MKKARLILSASLLTMGAFSAMTFTSCSKDDETCLVGFTGDDCKTEIRTQYYNTYRGSGSYQGSDGSSDTYTDWALRFNALGTDATKMRLNLLDANDAVQMSFDVTLTTNTTFSLVEKVDGNSTFTGSGTVNGTTASLTINETESGVIVNTYVYTFNNMIKE